MNITVRPSIIFALITQLRFIILLIPIRMLLEYFFQILPFWANIPSILMCFYYIYKVLLVRSNLYYISNEQITYQRGIFSLTTDYIEIYRIKDFRETQPFLLRLIGCMNLKIISSDKSIPLLLIKGIPSQSLITTLRKDVEHLRSIKRVYEIDS